MLLLPTCLTGEDDATCAAPPALRHNVTYQTMPSRATHGVDGFDFIKYHRGVGVPALHVMRDPDANLRGTAQINIEMHRMGMHDGDGDTPRGRDFNSLFFMQLLWATSPGFHPVSSRSGTINAAADVVGQPGRGGLLDAVASIRTRFDAADQAAYPTRPISHGSTRRASIRTAHQAARDIAKQQKAAGAHNRHTDAQASAGGGARLGHAAALRAPRRRRCSRSTRRHARSAPISTRFGR